MKLPNSQEISQQVRKYFINYDNQSTTSGMDLVNENNINKKENFFVDTKIGIPRLELYYINDSNFAI